MLTGTAQQGGLLAGQLAKGVTNLTLDGEPVRKLNNLIRSFASLPVTIHPA